MGAKPVLSAADAWIFVLVYGAPTATCPLPDLLSVFWGLFDADVPQLEEWAVCIVDAPTLKAVFDS